MLRGKGLRVESDLRGEKINYKIREHSLLKRPYIVVVGDKEKAAGLVALRARGNQDLGQMSPDALIERLLRENWPLGVQRPDFLFLWRFEPSLKINRNA